ncbi:EF-hand domain-containing protein [Streptomyces sp. NRRL WC-3742]|uniref:EF-hand domain-containing protein n=1 Tax=Streptomyces sp. NRRL WC-3742 TaxID=1463934 RepID=UPI0004C8596E|nr:EF-hand domain-containing protein [Streptomyces sp. NRRL WC-3742]
MSAINEDTLLDQKIDRCFGHIDAAGKGSIDREDLLTLGTRLLSEFGEQPTSPRGTRLMMGMTEFWDALYSAADTDGDSRLSREEYRSGMKGAFITSKDGFDATFRPLTEAICTLLDTDGNGEVDAQEFHAWQQVFGTSQADSHEAFRALDTDGSGALSVDELLAAMREYYTSRTAGASGNLLYGPLL